MLQIALGQFTGKEEEIYSRLHDTFNRTQVALALGIRRTTLWEIQTEIIVPARILDFDLYTKSHAKRLDFYCMTIFAIAKRHLDSQKLLREERVREGYVVKGSAYTAAAAIMHEQRKLYSRKAFDYSVEVNIIDKVQNRYAYSSNRYERAAS